METDGRREAGDAPGRRRVRELVERLNAAWIEGRADDLVPLFHEDVVMALPSFTGRAEGRDAMVESYRDFSRSAVVQAFEPGEISVDVFDGTAVATYTFRIEYRMDGAGYREEGREVLVLGEDDGRWQIVWRTLVSGPSE